MSTRQLTDIELARGIRSHKNIGYQNDIRNYY